MKQRGRYGMNGASYKIRAKTEKNRLLWSWWSPAEFNDRPPLLPASCHKISMAAYLLFLKENHHFLRASAFHSWSKIRLSKISLLAGITKRYTKFQTTLGNWPAAWGGGWTVALFRGVSAGWMGRIPGFGWVCPALGLWRGAMEVSVVGMGSVSLEKEKTILKTSHIKVWENGGGAFPLTLIQPFQICLIDISQRVLCVTRCYKWRF